MHHMQSMQLVTCFSWPTKGSTFYLPSLLPLHPTRLTPHPGTHDIPHPAHTCMHPIHPTMSSCVCSSCSRSPAAPVAVTSALARVSGAQVAVMPAAGPNTKRKSVTAAEGTTGTTFD